MLFISAAQKNIEGLCVRTTTDEIICACNLMKIVINTNHIWALCLTARGEIWFVCGEHGEGGKSDNHLSLELLLCEWR